MQDSFVETCVDVLSVVGPVRAQRMFGGSGLYSGGVMIALIADETLYLKVDETSRPEFERAGSKAFEFTRKDGRTVTMSYFEMPPEGFESPDAARKWASLALAAARAASTGRRGKPRRD